MYEYQDWGRGRETEEMCAIWKTPIFLNSNLNSL